MLYKHKHKARSDRAKFWAIVIGAFFGISLPANAVPEPLQIAQVRSRAIAPTPLNVTPLPGRHISLPRGRSSYGGYYDRGYKYRDRPDRHYYRHNRRSRGDTTIIIINPSRSKYSDRYRERRIRIIRP